MKLYSRDFVCLIWLFIQTFWVSLGPSTQPSSWQQSAVNFWGRSRRRWAAILWAWEQRWWGSRCKRAKASQTTSSRFSAPLTTGSLPWRPPCVLLRSALDHLQFDYPTTTWSCCLLVLLRICIRFEHTLSGKLTRISIGLWRLLRSYWRSSIFVVRSGHKAASVLI